MVSLELQGGLVQAGIAWLLTDVVKTAHSHCFTSDDLFDILPSDYSDGETGVRLTSGVGTVETVVKTFLG